MQPNLVSWKLSMAVKTAFVFSFLSQHVQNLYRNVQHKYNTVNGSHMKDKNIFTYLDFECSGNQGLALATEMQAAH